MFDHEGRQSSERAAGAVQRAPGKRSLTEGMVQHKAAPAAAAEAASPSSNVAEASPASDPFGLHLVQFHGAGDADGADVHAIAASGVSGAGAAMPHGDAIASSFGKFGGMVSGISAHVGGAAAEASAAMGAEAYATGSSIGFAAAPDLALAAHEAAHVVQQAGGVQLKGGVGEAGDVYERHADAVAAEVVAGRSAEGLLEQLAGGGGSSAVQQHVQRKDVATHFGTFKSTKFQKVATTGVEAIIEFHPDDTKINATKIGLSQSVKVTNGDGSHTANDPTTEGRRVGAGVGQDFATDRISERNNPVYGAPNLGANQGIDKTPKDNNASPDATVVGTNATFQTGYAYTDTGVKKKKEASLYDKPNSGSKTFETTALGLEGTDKDTYFGSVKWGYTNTGADVTISDIELASMGVPTQNYLAPAELWNNSKTRGTLEVKANPAKGWTRPGMAAVDIPQGTKLRQLGVYAIAGAPVLEAETLDGATKYMVKVTDMKDNGDGGETANVPSPEVFVNAAITGLFSDAQMTAKVKDLPASTRMENTSCSVHSSYGMKIVDGPDTGLSGFVDQTKVARER